MKSISFMSFRYKLLAIKYAIALLVVTVILQPSIVFAGQPLQGGVKIDERLLDKSLPALDPTLAPGNTFDKDVATALLRKEIPQNVWFKIPAWLAGNWLEQEATVTWSRDEITKRVDNAPRPEKNVTSGNFGYFPTVDQNFWWQFADSEYWGKSEKQTCTSWFFHQYIAPVDTNGQSMSIKRISIEFDVDLNSNKILQVYQRQDLVTDIQITDSLVQEVDYGRRFDFHGKAICSFHLTSNLKIASMACVNPNTTPSGRNPTELILAYLQDRGMQDEYDNIIRITQNPNGDHIAKLDETLSPGNQFNQDIATTLLSKNGGNNWVKRPNWFAGTWLPQEVTITHFRNEITGQEDNIPHSQKLDVSRLGEVDKQNAQVVIGYFPTVGAWWQFIDSGFWTRTVNQYTFNQQCEITQSNAGSDTVRNNATSITFTVDQNNKIQSVIQEQYRNITSKISDDLIQIDRDSKIYGHDGGLLSSLHKTIYFKKVGEPIVRTTTKSGQDATKSLFAFLIEHKMIAEAKTVIDTMRQKQMYFEADSAQKVLESVLPLNGSKSTPVSLKASTYNKYH